MNDHDHDCKETSLGTLIDHKECWRELRHVERERDDLRLEMASMRAEVLSLRIKLKVAEGKLALEEQPWR